MRWQIFPMIPVALLLVTAFSGCMDSAAIEDQFEDADDRTGRTYSGEASQDWTVNVPSGASMLQVSLAFKASGEFSAELFNPAGQKEATQTVDGASESVEDNWYRENDPTPGTWRVEIEGAGAGAYAVGVYIS